MSLLLLLIILVPASTSNDDSSCWICSCCVAVKKRTLAARAGTIVRSTNYRHRGLPSRRNGCTCSGLRRYRAVSYPPYRSTQRSSDRMYTHRRTSGLAGDPALRQRWVMLTRICTWHPHTFRTYCPASFLSVTLALVELFSTIASNKGKYGNIAQYPHITKVMYRYVQSHATFG